MKKIKLTKRMSAIASFVDIGSRTADIGTDHGYIPVYLRQNDICPYIIASDINEGPLQSAVRSASEYNVDNIEFVCAPGLDGISPGEVDTVIIAGMGGEVITEILRAANWLHSYGVKLILQPQSKIEILCSYLHSAEYKVTDARLIRENGKLYTIMVVENGISPEEDRDLTTFLFYKHDPLLCEYISRIIKNLEQRKIGMESSSVSDFDEIKNISSRIEKLNFMLTECEKWRL